ncbi:response regulator [Bacillus massilinigeriensis]|uniref:response regulator n=1 Tax=Bacillus mediterraneensis TaxID=1805474 RepID=UPI0008F8CEAA|nr:response regulator [Bacillus mediterraneensis]
MSFKKKQFFGLGLTVLFLSILLYVIILMTGTIKTNMVEIVEDRYDKVNKVMEMRQLLYVTDKEVLSHIDGSEKKRAADKADVNNKHEEMNRRIYELEEVLNKKKSIVLLKSFQEKYQDYAAKEEAWLHRIEQGESLLEVKADYDEQSGERNALLKTIDEFKNYQESLIGDAVKQSNDAYYQLITWLVVSVIIATALIVMVTLWVIRSTGRNLDSITKGIKNIDYHNLSSIPRLEIEANDEIGEIVQSFNSMAESLEEYYHKEKKFTAEIEEQNWVQTSSAEIISLYHRSTDVDSLADQFLVSIGEATGTALGAFYLVEGEGDSKGLRKIAGYADHGGTAGKDYIPFRESLVGQAAWQKKAVFLEEVPETYIPVSTGLGEVTPRSVFILPVLSKEETIAVIELASMKGFTPAERNLFEEVTDTLGIAIANILGRMEVERLLSESQAQAEELQSQSEELQAQSEELQTQSEELRMINEQLEERSREAELKSADLLQAKTELEAKAKELQLSSKYKSEFLANMSHELRTPLNSILLLSEMLAEDEERTLTEEQKEFARVINTSGEDLLNLINDILDLSKVEVGKIEVAFGEVNLKEFSNRLIQLFSHIAGHKELEFEVTTDDNLPNIFYTDEQRLQQIVKNLLSNAFKFTEKGSVRVRMESATQEEVQAFQLRCHAEKWLKLEVTDTGIGIPVDKHRLIFEAFQQGDGATMRKYGGTGLGLSISKEFAHLLGGMMMVDSEEGKGSTFTLYLPSLPFGMPKDVQHEEEVHAEEEALMAVKETATGSSDLKTNYEEETNDKDLPYGNGTLNGKRILIVDDDRRNIYALSNVLEREGVKISSAENGMECLAILREDSSYDMIFMDIMMPEMDGYETMKSIRAMEQGKEIPIIALTAKAMKGDREKCLEAGASDYISKPLKLDQLLSVMRVWAARE